tara:strand:- start:3334 stop:5148 length:1815 start_codon:yes stop_codon:yes gene_type:complete
MCGITGILSKKNLSNINNRIHRMNNSIIHRGPDSGGLYFNKNLALGHRRLSIIDTREISNQPMHSCNGEWHIVFNGEIYNFEEIKLKLSYEFTTNSDTEVILAAIQQKGVEWFLKQSNGMFSIAIYNSQTSELFLIRDRMGIKPLYYYLDDDNLVFSSEIKAILNSGLIKVEFNESAVDEYLANRYVRAPYTFFKNIFQVNSGEYITFNADLKAVKIKYWDLPNKFNLSNQYNETDILTAFDNELNKAIKYRLIADVPLGTYLSGGVDSSIITAITALNTKKRINTYTIGFDELNEFEYAKTVAEKYNTIHHEIVLNKKDYLSNWERIISFKDSPLGVPNEIPLAVMSSKLKEKITVVLSGEGADELLGGYGRIFRSPYDYENEKPSISFYEYFIKKYEYVPREMRDKLINTPVDYRSEFDTKINKQFSDRSNKENVFKFFHEYHVKGLLQRVDTTTMQTSVEARVPFLDHNLIEFSYKMIPYDLKLKWINQKAKLDAKNLPSHEYSEKLDIPKYLLRKVSYKYIPKEIIERKKMGFPVPLTDWFDNLEAIALKELNTVSWLKKGALEDLIRKSRTEAMAGQILWMFINIELFKKKYFLKDWRW